MGEVQDRVFRILRTEKRKLPVKLTPDEFRAAAKRAAQIADEIASTDREIEGYQSTVKGLKARKETLEVERSQESRKVRLEVEDREVEVAVEVEDGTNTVFERRTDTNEILRERGLTQQEAQVSIFHEVRQDRPRGDDEEQKALPPAPEETPKKKRGRGKKPASEVTVDIGDLDKLDEEEDPIDSRAEDDDGE
jgi:hypothetical protein